MTKIIYKIGDLLKSDCNIKLHGCNSRGVMGAGIAKSIRSNYPECFNVYSDFCKLHNYNNILGEIVWYNHSDNHYIGNAISQEFYGKDGKCYISYDAINSIMIKADNFAESLSLPVVAMPLIGAGLGGGSWKKISSIIEAAFKYATPVVYTLDGKIPLK